MLDDIREWISDNLRYILLGLAVVLVFIILFCIVRLVTGSKKPKEPAREETVVQQNEDVTEAENTSTPAPAAVQQSAAPTQDLTRNDSALLSLVKQYYEAVAAKDVGTLSQIVSPFDSSVQNNLLGGDVVEAYNNVTTYSKKGLTEGSYIVYAYYDSKISGIETLVPSLSRLYVITDESGALVVSSDADKEQDVADYITSVSTDADVQALIADVNRQYQAAIDSDSTLKEYIDTIGNGSSSGSGDDSSSESGESTSGGQEMTATAGLNIRQEPSTQAAILGSVVAGTNVTVLEQVEDGWCRISYSYNNQGPIEGYVKLEYLKAAETAA